MAATMRRRKGGGNGSEGGGAAGAEGGAPTRRAAPRQPGVLENLERWGYACSVVGKMFRSIWQLLVAVVLWVCPMCAREEKRQLRSAMTARALLSEAAALVDKDKYKEALDKANGAVELYEDGGSDGSRASAFRLRGLILATLGKDEEAVKDFDQQIKLQPDRVDALVQRGSLRFRMDEMELALADFDCAATILRTAEEKMPGDNSATLASVLHQRGLIHVKLDDLYAAVDDVTEAFKLQRHNETYKQHMGELAQKLAHHVAVNGPRGAENPLPPEAAQLATSLLSGAIPTT